MVWITIHFRDKSPLVMGPFRDVEEATLVNLDSLEYTATCLHNTAEEAMSEAGVAAPVAEA